MQIELLPLGSVTTLAPGERLLDALDEAGLTVLPTACRSANCGICTVIVRGDSQGLEPPRPDEQRFLAGLGIAANQRLGCQIHAAADSQDELVIIDVLAAQRR